MHSVHLVLDTHAAVPEAWLGMVCYAAVST